MLQKRGRHTENIQLLHKSTHISYIHMDWTRWTIGMYDLMAQDETLWRSYNENQSTVHNGALVHSTVYSYFFFQNSYRKVFSFRYFYGASFLAHLSLLRYIIGYYSIETSLEYGQVADWKWWLLRWFPSNLAIVKTSILRRPIDPHSDLHLSYET